MEWFYQIDDQLHRAWAYVTDGKVLATTLGIGFALLSVVLLIASRTKWGQAKPLTKCVVVSVLLHVIFLMYALGTRKILPQGDLAGREQAISVSFDDSFVAEIPALPSVPAESTAATPHAWEAPVPLAELPKPPELEDITLDESFLAPELLPTLEATPLPALPPEEELADLESPEATTEDVASHSTSSQPTSELPAVLPPESTEPTGSKLASQPDFQDIARPTTPMQPTAANESPILPPTMQLPPSNLPKEYQLRQAPNRLKLSQAYGADADSEAAVDAGLKWLASAQSPDGSWVAVQFGAGTETRALGEYRAGTGDKADTGVSGLALLAFLSAGHTHREGEHRATVQQGLAYLIDAQMPSGDLSGPKQVGNENSVLNARMYCHSIATLALAEAYAMTLDPALRDSLLRAAQYSINAQDVRGGGWRYRPRDPGDLSQFGWQAMALKSLERSGIEVPIEVQRRMRRFLDSCSAGPNGGLATYKPREGRPSDTMTAEALACRLLLDYPLSREAQSEATRMIMNTRPGVGEDNVYFWYYATLALFQLQDENWRVWNQAMKARLLQTQIPAYGQQPGSWDPDQLWGGYGGRVYSTAMSCLCLEVYYRYLPMYQRSNIARTPRPPQFSR